MTNGEPRHGATVAHGFVRVGDGVKLARTADFDQAVTRHASVRCES